jgi:hypothetical protein
MNSINLAPVDVSYTLNSTVQRRNVERIPTMESGPKRLYENNHTYKLAKKMKPKQDISKVSGFASLAKFDPEDLGIPK